MMIHDYSPWISPVTGTQELPQDYIWVGSITGTPGDPSSFAYVNQPSPILIDIRLDLLELKSDVSNITRLNDGLGYGVFPYAHIVPIPDPTYDGSNTESSIKNPLFGNVISSTYTGIHSPSDPSYAQEIVKPSNWMQSVSNSFPLSQFKTEQALARLNLGQFVVKTRGLTYNWPNQKAIDLIPDEVKETYGLGGTYSFDEAQALDELISAPGIAKISRSGDIEIAVSGWDYVTPLEMESAITGAVSALEFQIGALELQILAIEWELYWLGIGTLIAGGLGLLGTLLGGFNTLKDLFASDDNIEQINNTIAQNTTINGMMDSISSLEESLGEIFSYINSNEIDNRINQNIQNILDNITLNPRSISLNDQYILLGNALGEAQEVPLDSLGLLNEDILLHIRGDVTFQALLGSYQTKIRNDPIFYGQSITIPYGNTASRPMNPTIGMLRCNTDLQ